MEIVSITIPGAKLRRSDERIGVYTYALSPPMAPGAGSRLAFDLRIENRGFVNGNDDNKVVSNGTFFNNFDYFPHIGYSRAAELGEPNARRKYGLPPIQRFPKIDDQKARMRNYLSSESDWVNFKTTVSTSPDQIAIAPGYLQREWMANGRRYFRYEMDAPILGFWSYLSARYEVKKDRWRDVAIEVYYDPAHPYNVDRMIDAVKKSLDYFTANFSPYQHRQVRIVEFPRYARFAQSFPNTIPFSESIGFVANLKDEDSIDYVFYVTAHEVAHQWWAHQVIGANVQGATVMSETMSQYSALMVMEKEYGREKMQRFLKYELDNYLRGRGGELIEEMPLLLVENQGYIHYRKGSLVMYALRDYVGEQELNRALAEYVRAVAFQQPPYTTSLEFLSYLRKAVPPDKQQIITDLFETITLYENRATEAKVTRRGDQYVVRMTVEAKKLRSDGAGRETVVPLNDWIDVGVLGGPKGKDVIHVEKRLITQPSSTIELVVGSKPSKAGIDPMNKLIDRNPDDNVKTVDGAS
jgi:ABC-2 type transport system permease protein